MQPEVLASGVARAADDHHGGQHPTKRLAVLGQLGPSGAPPTHRTLTVPDQGARHRTQPVDQLPPPGEQVLSPRDGIRIAANQRE
jgi:hypothetical protein